MTMHICNMTARTVDLGRLVTREIKGFSLQSSAHARAHALEQLARLASKNRELLTVEYKTITEEE